MANKTIYVSGESVGVWDELVNYLRIYERRSLSDFLTAAVKKELARLKAKHGEDVEGK